MRESKLTWFMSWCAPTCTMICCTTRQCSVVLASSPGPTHKLGKGLVTLGKLPICAVSAVFIWSRGITFVHCQLTTFLTHEGSRLVRRPFKNGNKASRLFAKLKFQKLRVYLHLLRYYSCLIRFACSRCVARSVHLLCNAIMNSSWPPHDHVSHVMVT